MESRTLEADFDPVEWAKKDFTERVRIATNAYVLQRLAHPLPVYLFHAVKLTLFVLGWMFFCSFTPGLGAVSHFTTWIFEGPAFQKAFLWASLVEVAGFGVDDAVIVGSGPNGLAAAIARRSAPTTSVQEALEDEG